MGHGPAANWGKDNASAYKTKTGIQLFIAYCMIYSGFVIINTTEPGLMGVKVFAGLNLASVYGFGLIILAIVMGLMYNYVCSKAEDKLNVPEKGAKK